LLWIDAKAVCRVPRRFSTHEGQGRPAAAVGGLCDSEVLQRAALPS
jgi:hypothetical protein